MHLQIRGGTLVFDGLEMVADLYVNDGKVVGMGSGFQVEAERTIEANGCLVLPGMVDLDSLLDPVVAGDLEGDTVARATQMAILGGFTTMTFDVPATAGIGATRDTLARSSFCDYALRALVAKLDGSRRKASELARGNEVAAVRLSMRRLGGLEPIGEDDIALLLRDLAGLRPVFVFPQNGPLGDLAQSSLDPGLDSVSARTALHPSHLSRLGLRALATLLEQSSGNAVAMPITSASEIEALLEARERLGAGMMAATNLGYLVFHGEGDSPAARARVQAGYPPVRRKPDLVALWKAVDAGLIDAIATGASTPGDDLLGNPMFALPALYAAGVASRRVSLPTLVSALADNPAKMLSLYPGKGTLQVGSDADIVIFDPTGKTEAPDNSPYHSIPMEGCVRTVLRRGEAVVTEGQIAAPASAGRELPPQTTEVRK